MQPIIKVENLGKSYIIGHQRERYVALRDVLANKAKQTFSRTKNIFSGGQLIAGNEMEEFWALKDINFEVQQGDRLGIIGRNGAGKSTLLKVLSRITEPTTGRIRLKGRVASLLEVGTGFHPELSGRENIYLNGAILGMSRVEVRKKFDEIVDFAGVEKFLDTPVKRYSSGMYVRLAFAVAAHLEPEILIIDEVLAVGDAEFQKKCLGKMEDVSKNDGRTVIFVSHNMGAVKSLCNKGIILENGNLSNAGSINECVDKYLNGLQNKMKSNDLLNIPRSGNGELRITRFHVEDNKGIIIDKILAGNDVNFVFKYEKQVNAPLENVSLGFSIHNNNRDLISILYSDFSNDLFEIKESIGTIKCRINSFPFSQGKYFIGLRVIMNGTELDYPKELISSIDVENGFFYKNTNITHSGIGTVLIKGEWKKDE